MRKPPADPDATTQTVSRQDADGFIRTGLVVENEGKGRPCNSVDVVRIVDGKVERIALLNIMLGTDGRVESLIIDVIDADNRYTTKRALTFAPTERAQIDVPTGGNLVSVDFRRKI